MVAFLDPATAPEDVGSVVEDERYANLGRFDCVAHGQEFLPCHICLLCLTLECCFRHDTWFQAYTGVRAQLLLEDFAFVFRVDGRGVGWSATAGRRGGRRAGVCIVVCINAKRELALGSYLALLPK